MDRVSRGIAVLSIAFLWPLFIPILLLLIPLLLLLVFVVSLGGVLMLAVHLWLQNDQIITSARQEDGRITGKRELEELGMSGGLLEAKRVKLEEHNGGEDFVVVADSSHEQPHASRSGVEIHWEEDVQG